MISVLTSCLSYMHWNHTSLVLFFPVYSPLLDIQPYKEKSLLYANIPVDIEQCLNYFCHHLKTIRLVSYNPWSIGKERNSIVFENNTINIDRIYYRAWHIQHEWTARTMTNISCTSSSLPSCTTPIQEQVRWHPSSKGCYKLNFDGSVIGSSVSVGVVIRNSDGQVLAAQA